VKGTAMIRYVDSIAGVAPRQIDGFFVGSAKR
jgi:hypothetical protein